MGSLADRLKALGVKGVGDAAGPAVRRAYPLQDVVSGRTWDTGVGAVYVVERRYPLAAPHGSRPLGFCGDLTVVAEWAREPTLATLRPHQLVFLDVESTGLARGAGTYAFLVGLGRYDEDAFVVTQFFMPDPAGEAALLAALTQTLKPYPGLVTFNGKAYDAVLLDTRYVASWYGSREDATHARTAGEGEVDAASPLGAMAHLDLLPLARRLWRDRLPSRALGYLEEHVLDVTRAEDDVPGWMIPGLYFDYLRSGDARPLEKVFHHNAVDLLSLAALLRHVVGILNDPLGCADVHELDLVALAKLFEDLGHLDTAVRLYRRGLERDLPKGLYSRAVRRLSFMYKRRGHLERATELWEEAALDGQVYACVELAKYQEHVARDYEAAARWAQRALFFVDRSGGREEALARAQAQLTHRLRRLRAKMARTPG